MKRTPGLMLVALLALAQGVAGVLRATQWIKIGIDLAGRGALVLPIIGDLAIIRGGIVGVIALLFGLFAWGALGGHGWAWSMGLAAAIVNALIVLGLLLGGAPAGQALLWAIVPAILIVYLLSPAGRHALGTGSKR